MDANLWKDEAEYKKQMDELVLKLKFGCYEENKSEPCHHLADYYITMAKTPVVGANLLMKNCDENKYGPSCEAYGRISFKGLPGEKPDFHKAFEYFNKGCDLDDPKACYHGGQMIGIVDHGMNRLIKPQPEKALNMLIKACKDGKHPAACTLVHSFYLRGFHDQPQDLKKAAEYAEIACEQGSLTGCYNLSRMYHLGEGFDRPNPEKSRYYFEKAKGIKEAEKLAGKGRKVLPAS